MNPEAEANHKQWVTQRKRHSAKVAERLAERAREEQERRQRGEATGRKIHGIFCPQCGAPGPHERTGVAPTGDAITVICGESACSYGWRVTG